MSEQHKEDMCSNCDGESVSCSVMKMIKNRIREINKIYLRGVSLHEKEFLETLVYQIKTNKGVV